MEGKKIIAKYIGLDGWSRPVFKTESRQHYCLIDLPEDLEHLADLVAEANKTEGLIMFKGSDPDGEPGWPVKNVILTLQEQTDAQER